MKKLRMKVGEHHDLALRTYFLAYISNEYNYEKFTGENTACCLLMIRCKLVIIREEWTIGEKNKEKH